MKISRLSCFQDFRCLAGACPDTCCAGWEIDLDEDTLARYQALPGPLGDRVRSKIKTEDGYTFFGLEAGRCPFLNGDGLCELILAQGEEALSVTCREHPRFIEEYGELQEVCLSISCPEAARLLLEEPLSLVTEENDAPWEEDWDLDESYLAELLVFRQKLFAELSTPQSLAERVSRILAAADAQLDLPSFLNTMKQMEFTAPRLLDLLERCSPEPADTLLDNSPVYGGKLLAYFLYRYVLRAVWDGDLLGKVRFAVHSTAAILALAAGPLKQEAHPIRAAAILYSREAEHSDENLRLLGAALD